jgi:hypothetical protein
MIRFMMTFITKSNTLLAEGVGHMGTTARKERRTYSLNPELVRYIEKVREERGIESASSALEQIICESKRQRDRKHQDDLISNYYTSLDEADIEQEKQWGRFAETQFLTE